MIFAYVCVCVFEHIKIPCRNVRNIMYDLLGYIRMHSSITTSRVYWAVSINSFQLNWNVPRCKSPVLMCGTRTNGKQVTLNSTSVILNRLLRCVSCSICFQWFCLPNMYPIFQFSYILSCRLGINEFYILHPLHYSWIVITLEVDWWLYFVHIFT